MRMILQDEDITTKIENDWKRLNTLAHYQVGGLWKGGGAGQQGPVPCSLSPGITGPPRLDTQSYLLLTSTPCFPGAPGELMSPSRKP